MAQTPSERDSINQNITYHHRYPYIAFVDSAYAPTFSNEEFQAVAATVVFPVNSTRLPADNPVLVELSDEVLPVLPAIALRCCTSTCAALHRPKELWITMNT